MTKVVIVGAGLLAGKERLIREFERQAVLRFLRETGGNISVDARKARITRRNFHRLIAKHAIDRTAIGL